MIYSHSRLSAFEQCPLKFKMGYIDEIEVEVEDTIEAFLGSRVHEVLEWLYKQVKMCKIPSAKECLAYFEEQWAKEFNKDIKINNAEFSAKDYFNSGKKFIEKYYQRYSPFDENTIATEKRIMIDLDGSGKYKICGFIDRLVYNEKEKCYEIHDYKTNKTLKEQSDLEQDRQLALYSIAIKQMYPDANKISLIWHFLAFDKEFTVYKTDKQLEDLKKYIIELIQTIEKTKDFKAVESSLCSWCEFQSICPRFKHFHELKQMPINKYLKEEGVQLVNKYAELNKKKKEFMEQFEAEMELIKEAVIAYAKKKGIDVLFGSDNKLSVKFSKKFRFPAKNTKERKELDKFIIGIKKWNEVSTLDVYALERIMEGEEWPKAMLDELKKFGKLEDEIGIRISKKKEGEK